MKLGSTFIKSLIVLISFMPIMAHAQKVSEDVIKFGKETKNGFVARSKYGRTQMNEILATKFSVAGFKKHGKKSKFHTYKGVIWTVTGPNKVDLYYKVSGKKHRAKVYFIASKGYDNYITSTTDASAASSITEYLSQLDAAIAQSEELKQKEKDLKELNANLEKQKENLKKTEAVKDQKSLEIKHLQKTESY